MKDKAHFSEFIAEKRKEVNLTQKEFAKRLFVSDTAVSKWERGLSYPDITLISKICEELHITEHEFIHACDDISVREEKQQAKRYRGFLKVYQWAFIASYCIALVTCFICNVAISHTLSWFFIVLPSLALAFSITTLPVMLKKYKTLITFGVATILIYILLFVCAVYTSGNWLFTIAYPIATAAILAVWLTMLVIKYLKTNWFLKSGIISLLWGAITVTTNPFVDYLLGFERGFTLKAYFNLYDWQFDLISSKIVFWCLALWGVAGIIAGILKDNKKDGARA